MARACGSYPQCHRFKSSRRYHTGEMRQHLSGIPLERRPVGQEVKTRPFHGCNMGSIPVRVIKAFKQRLERFYFLPARESNRAAVQSTVSNPPYGLLLSPRVPAYQECLRGETAVKKSSPINNKHPARSSASANGKAGCFQHLIALLWKTVWSALSPSCGSGP